VFTAGSIAVLFAVALRVGSSMTGPLWAKAMILAAIFVFLAAAGVVFYKARTAQVLAVVAGLAALSWFVLTELSFPPELNSWVALNGFDHLTKLRILSIALIIFTITISTLRLLLYERTWPALLLTGMVIIPWFIHSVRTSEGPTRHKGVTAELRMILVQKERLRFDVTEVSVFRDGRVYIVRKYRNRFQYRYLVRSSLAVISPMLLDQARAIANLAEFSKKYGEPTFLWGTTTESGIVPSRRITDFFLEILKVPVTEDQSYEVRDICLGFCYSPLGEFVEGE
jgi:hypothetical protein